MKSRITITRSTFTATMVVISVTLFLARPSSRAHAAEAPTVAPPHQVIACYFHRTKRCPTCQKISAYIEESVEAGFEDRIKDGTVRMLMVDFQNAKNQKLTEAYKITGPTLVILDIHDGKVTGWKAAPKVWSLVSKKNEFFKYVQQEVKGYLDGERTAVR